MEGENQVQEVQEQNLESVNTVLSERYGEGFSVDSIGELKTNYEKLQADFKNEKIKFEESRYASPLSKQIDEKIRNGWGKPQIMKFLSLQDIKLNEMSPEDMIKQKVSMERPEFSAKEVDLWFQDKFGVLDEDDEDAKAIRDVRIKEAYLDAKKYLESQMVEAENPQISEDKKAEEAAKQQLRERYSIRADSLMKQVDKIPNHLKTKDFEYNFDFNVPKNAEIDKGIMQAAVDFAESNGLPLDGSADKQISEFIREVRERVYHREIVEAIIRDGWASSRKDAIIEQSNPAPLPSGSGNVANPKPPAPKKSVVTQKGSTFV